MEINKENDGPEFEVGIHLESGLDMARNELDGLSEDLRTWLTVLGKQIVSLQTNLVADEDNKLADVSRTLLEEPWIKYVSDLAFAEDAITRASAGFDRYVELRPILKCYELSEVATKCLQRGGTNVPILFRQRLCDVLRFGAGTDAATSTRRCGPCPWEKAPRSTYKKGLRVRSPFTGGRKGGTQSEMHEKRCDPSPVYGRR